MLPLKKPTGDDLQNGMPPRSGRRTRQEQTIVKAGFLPRLSRINQAALQPKLGRRIREGFAGSVMSLAEPIADAALAVGSLLVAEFLASCAAYACAMYSSRNLAEEGEAPVAPRLALDQPRGDWAQGHAGKPALDRPSAKPVGR